MVSTVIPSVKREDVKPGDNLCSYCTGKCCRYFALPMETPTTWKDFDYIRWYMIHGRVSVFVDDETWYLMVHNDCSYLLPNNFCGAYEKRPSICREYTTESCEYDGDGAHDKYFETPEQIWEYAEAVLPRVERKEAARTLTLPIIEPMSLESCRK
ncbi:YkgJ family cysteine cluster protein [Calycomorphotria hydatis]|uniref:Flagellin N-methylase n=1 Tax=Calycomorphotria hydatis TaxID=2528027 RepID=A0A517T773_9PLAN|nr:YkgJ family cysteine cluster protein [Calycomorphotria hydatis]QDT64221.1 Flagellin N-methylase [Calycomorphotria hydatis]